MYRLQLPAFASHIIAPTPAKALQGFRRRGFKLIGGAKLPAWAKWRRTSPSTWVWGAGLIGAELTELPPQ